MNGLIFKVLVGSHAYGTDIATSDTDYKGVYRQSFDELLGFGYREQIDVSKDETYYEARRFLQLLQVGNPTMLELLYTPADCVLVKEPAFELILQQRERFLTKKCLQSFGGYALAQIRKAKGLDKKMNWEKARVTRKTPLDFVYAYENGKTLPVEKWLNQKGLQQAQCGLVALDHFRDGYALYYDEHSNLGFKGIVLDDSNALRVSSVPKGMQPLTIVCYNKDGYSKHCKDFKEYTDWLAARNTDRYVDVKGHGQQIDGKNLLHCRRLLDMAIEIATEKTIHVRRPNADYLLQIRRGEVPLNDIIEAAERDIDRLNELFAASDLPEEVDQRFVNGLLLAVRYAL